MLSWFEVAEEQIEQDHDNGLINDRQYREQLRDLYAEYEQEAQLAAKQAYDNYY